MVAERVKMISKNNTASLEERINAFLESSEIAALKDIKIIQQPSGPTMAFVIYYPPVQSYEEEEI